MCTAPAIRASSSGICQTISSLVACFGHSFELTPPRVYDVAATCEKEAHQAFVEMHGKLRSAQEAPIAIANIIWEALSDGERERKMAGWVARTRPLDRKSTRLNSSHEWISYAVFCLKKK